MRIEKVEEFKKWVEDHGAIILESNNEYEVLRFKTVNGVGIVYRNKYDKITPTGEALEAAIAFEKGNGWAGAKRKRQNLNKRKERIAERDGQRCFVHRDERPLDELTIEHVLSHSHGGPDNINNLILVCQDMNNWLGNKSVAEKMNIILKQRFSIERKENVATVDEILQQRGVPVPEFDTYRLQNPNAVLKTKPWWKFW